MNAETSYVERYKCTECPVHVPDPLQYDPCQSCGSNNWTLGASYLKTITYLRPWWVFWRGPWYKIQYEERHVVQYAERRNEKS